MSRGLKTIFHILIWIVIIAYLVTAMTYFSDVSKSENICSGLNVNIKNSDEKFVDADLVSKWVDSLRIPITGIPMDSVKLEQIEKYLRSKPYVQKINVYPSINGECNVDISQREVIFRVISSQGHDFFVDTVGYILNPMGQWQKKVPVITTDLKLPFDTEKYGKINNFGDTAKYYLQKLSNFANILVHDDFLSSLVTQIRITGDIKPGSEEVRLVPRVGRQIIVLGSFEDMDSKLNRLKKFYKKTFKDGWWQDADQLCFQYGNKVIVKRNTKI